MNKIYLFIAIVFMQINMFAQTPGYTLLPVYLGIDTAIPVCQLDSTYNATDSILNSNVPISFCGQGSVGNNAQWVAFIAGSTDITLQFNVQNCTITSQGQGLQFVIFGLDTDNNFVNMGPCIDSGGQPQDEYIVNGYNMTTGDIYYIIIDGWAGCQCDYEINILEGSISPGQIVIDSISISNDGMIVENCPVIFSVPNYGLELSTEWATTGGDMEESDYYSVLTFDTAGIYTVCFNAVSTGNCDIDSINICRSVEIFPDTITCNIGFDSISMDLTYCHSKYDVLLDFNHNEGTSFQVMHNNILIGEYQYSNLPIELQSIEKTCTSQNVFTILDVDNQCCQTSFDFGTVCCADCNIYNLVDEIGEYDYLSETYDITIDFDYATPVNDSFKIFYDNIILDTLNLNELPVNIEIPCTDNSTAEIKVQILGSYLCRKSKTLTLPCLLDTLISNLSYEVICGDENTSEILISFNQTGADSCFINVDHADSLSYVINENGDILNYSLGVFTSSSQTPFNIALSSSCEPDLVFDIQIPIDSLFCMMNNIDDLYDQKIMTYYDQKREVLIIKNKLSNFAIEKVELYTLLGQRLLSFKDESNETIELNLAKLPSQTLLINITLSNGHTVGKKVVKY